MKIYEDISLRNFKFWSGGKDNSELLTSEELDKVEDMYFDIESDKNNTYVNAYVNDCFWFDFRNICACIDLDYEEVIKRKD